MVCRRPGGGWVSADAGERGACASGVVRVCFGRLRFACSVSCWAGAGSGFRRAGAGSGSGCVLGCAGGYVKVSPGVCTWAAVVGAILGVSCCWPGGVRGLAGAWRGLGVRRRRGTWRVRPVWSGCALAGFVLLPPFPVARAQTRARVACRGAPVHMPKPSLGRALGCCRRRRSDSSGDLSSVRRCARSGGGWATADSGERAGAVRRRVTGGARCRSRPSDHLPEPVHAAGALAIAWLGSALPARASPGSVPPASASPGSVSATPASPGSVPIGLALPRLAPTASASHAPASPGSSPRRFW